jgi:hypothetical protein
VQFFKYISLPMLCSAVAGAAAAGASLPVCAVLGLLPQLAKRSEKEAAIIILFIYY